MTAKPRAKASTGRKTIGQSQERCDDAPGQEAQNTASSESRTADFADDADKNNAAACDLSAPSALSVVKTSTKSGAKNRRKRTEDFADNADKTNKSRRDSSAISAQSAVKTSFPSTQSRAESGMRDAATASELLVSILARRREVWRGRGKYVEPTPIQSDALPAIPKHWSWASLEQISWTSSYGTSAKCSPDNSGPPVLRIPNISKGLIDLSDLKFANEAEVIDSGDEVAPGDLLIIRTNGSRNLIGRAAVVRKPLERTASYASYLIRFRLLSPGILSEWVSAIWDSHFLRSWIEQRAATSAGQHNISMSVLSTMPIPLPPPAEQHRIVAEIEKQFTRLDAGVAALKRVQANLKRYRAAVLKAACEGRLVPTEAELRKDEGRRMKDGKKRAKPGGSTSSFIPHTSSFESGEALLTRILTERRQNWQGRGQYKEPAAPNALAYESDALPEGWTWASLDQLLQNITDGDHLPPPQTDSGIPLLVIGNIRTGHLSFKDTRFVARDYYDAIDPYRRPRWGDILYSLVGSYGIGLRVDTENEFCIQRHIGVMRPHGLSPSDYLVHVLNSRFVFKQATAAATGTAQKTVSLAQLRQFAIPLPPLAEQTRIVAEVERRLSVTEELETVVSANLQRATRLRQSILQKAFTGELEC